MRLNKVSKILVLFVFLLHITTTKSQISPGELSQPHATLEGVSNCTQCHSVAKQVTNAKCLACHKEIQTRITAKKGYHSSSEVRGKTCASCHNEHHGRNFKLIKFDKNKFNHALSGFILKGKHAKTECKECHKPAFISDPTLKKHPNTFLGLQQTCLSCHDDYHQGKMSKNCAECHNFDSWKNAKAFDHNKTKFPLLGKHKALKCEQCHKTELINGKPAQKFTGLVFNNCTGCHKDAHDNRFGQNCKQCHTEESFHTIKGMNKFDHDKTDFKLVGKHKLVSCKSCHKTTLTAPLKHDRCTDCHTDYHKGQFAVNGKSPDCNQCHSMFGYTPSEFTIEKHNQTKFKLEGGHLATSCTQCHKKDIKKDWSFRKVGEKCVDCHTNVHKGFISEKYIPKDDCTVCHTVNNWKTVSFDHSKTNFKLDGEHAKQTCAACHYPKDEKLGKVQKFKGMSTDCEACHKDTHAGQFAENGKTNCSKCHGTDKWENSKFDHNTSRFKLDGKHVDVKCVECHKPVTNQKGTYIEYKFDSIDCSKCHS
jgi:predicted CXXCH cytochrome family protein